MEFQKEKNLKDLEYNTLLNHFNIIALFIGTTYITIIMGTLEIIKWNIYTITSTAIFSFLLVILIWMLFYSKLKKIKKEIEAL